MNYTTIFLLIKFVPWPGLVRVGGLLSLGLGMTLGSLSTTAQAQVFSGANLVPSLIPAFNPNQLIPQLIPNLPGNTSTCSPFQSNVSQCLNQYRNIRIPEPVLRTIVPGDAGNTSGSGPPPTAITPTVAPPPPPLPAPGTVTQSNCPANTSLVLLPGGYACMIAR